MENFYIILTFKNILYVFSYFLSQHEDVYHIIFLNCGNLKQANKWDLLIVDLLRVIFEIHTKNSVLLNFRFHFQQLIRGFHHQKRIGIDEFNWLLIFLFLSSFISVNHYCFEFTDLLLLFILLEYELKFFVIKVDFLAFD